MCPIAKGRKEKYVMKNMEDNTSGIWLFEYDNENRLKYKIDLFWRTDNKESTIETIDAPEPEVKIKHF
jgi:hypothetical protein